MQDGRKQLEQVYGKGCMFKKAKVEEQLYALRSKRIIKICTNVRANLSLIKESAK